MSVIMDDSGKLTQHPVAVRLHFKWIKLLLCLGTVLLLAVFFMVGWLLIAEQLQKVVAATWGVVEKGYWTEALYLREEKPLTVPEAGNLIIQVKNGVRVPQGEILALLDRGIGSGPDAAMDNATRQNFSKYQMLVREEAALTADLRRINADLSKHLKKLGDQKTSSDLAALQQEKAEAIRNINIIRAQSGSLHQELAAVLKRWQFITAAAPGSFSAEYDGWEGLFQPEHLSRLTLNDFTRKYSLRSTAGRVSGGETFGRLVNPFNQIMALKINARQTGIPRVGTIWRLKISGGWRNAPLTYVRMFNSQTGVAGVALQADDANLTMPRLAKVFVIYRRVTGVTVPVQALFKKENQTTIRLAKGVGYREKPVQVVDTDGNKAVVLGIEVGDMIISR